ncbi:MAG: hypothetical protein JNL21_33655, partial [Myxococcales bacterium]|nr:hypothetical protein [Myxococcales bacterium]
GTLRNFTLKARSFGLDHRVVTRTLGSFELSPGAQTQQTIQLQNIPIKSVSHSSELSIELTTTHDGKTLTMMSPPAFVHFNSSYTQATVYSYDAMNTTQNGGQLVADGFALAGQIWNGSSYVDITLQRRQEAGGTPIPDMGPIYTIQGGGGGLDQPAPGGWFTACGWLTTKFIDATSGDFANTPGQQTLRASYVKADIRRTTTVPCGSMNPDQCSTLVWSGYLDANGCVSFNAQNGAQYQLKMYSQLRRTLGAFVWQSTLDYFDATQVNKGPRVFHRSFKVPLLSGSPLPPTSANVYPAYQPTMNVVATLSRLFVLGIEAGNYDTHVNIGCNDGNPGDPGIPTTDSCAGNSYTYIGPESVPGSDLPGDMVWKNVIAHEFGHQVQRKSSGVPQNPYSFNCLPGVNPGDPPICQPDDFTDNASCRCDHVVSANRLHCLQSSEQATAANVEGFAHFIANRIWNDAAGNDCSYNYYKEFNVTQNGYIESPPYQVDCRNAVRWRDNKCFKALRGTEYDWMQFFWNVNTVGSNKLSLDDIQDIHLEACNGSCTSVNVSWSLLRQGALDHFNGDSTNPQFLNFSNRGDDFGVDEDKF